ncbi:MAG: hypothetical protein LBQ01_01965, partial [Prevotellaceae bacterium]|jgi:hypothetical protein|nr:hypothetical protein [Prevotellaceae bacterium]
MDEQLFGFLWEDAVSVKFKADYDERLQSLKTKLLPAMEKYQQHLDEEAAVIDSYTENGSPSLSAFKAAAISAGVVGAGAAAAAGAAAGQGIAGEKTENVLSSIAGGANRSEDSTLKKGKYIYDGRDFSSVFKNVDLSYKKWGNMTVDQKVHELQKLENSIADIQKRTPDTVVAVSPQQPEQNWGSWNDYKKGQRMIAGMHSGNEIQINRSLVEGDNTYEKLKMAVNTVAHEGEHDYQDEKNLFPENRGANYIKEGDNKPICIIEYDRNGRIDRRATVLNYRQAAINSGNRAWNVEPNSIVTEGYLDINYNKVRASIGSKNPSVSAQCNWDDYAYGNISERDSRKFGNYIEKLFEQNFPEKAKRIEITNNTTGSGRPIDINDLKD